MNNNLLTMLAVIDDIAPNGPPIYIPTRKPPKDPTSEESINKLEAAEAKRKRRATRNKDVE